MKKKTVLYCLSWTVLFAGFISLIHHFGGPAYLSTWGAKSVEMAASTSVCFILIGIILLISDFK